MVFSIKGMAGFQLFSQIFWSVFGRIQDIQSAGAL